ncbi:MULTISPECIES: 4-hydroxy-tetrahydrodipicolinate reductase [unclassified Ruminococcus]|uniref:4-hydroxy-tetrahydrodipicolinate reductase n=1 Tax=unclassified Ruminococcus TaxID=2608920 RepID=UPI0021091D94|nr:MULTISPECIES: 4-hydroxy-tetrahydrodipicolinate reductase [unclassified Ruminococcus]MCQ4022470.1 4-hydroxy-tetrahydrodipicolinate reductase [Ruminococcus sp. zg-924]MCQ4115190.1 4-hydroxy-tetrahydrodipicolinate reductase [Ruminococcus sp. zg-921]
MTRIILCGCNGKMGQAIVRAVSERDDCKIVAGVDIITNCGYDFPVFDDFSKIDVEADVIIDFSNPVTLKGLLKYAVENKKNAIICTTGYTQEQIEQINEASKFIGIFRSGNMSIGINLLIDLVKKAKSILGDAFDVEIIEKHHNQKIDAPSGTALMIADAISEAADYEPQYIYDRHAYRKKREKNEIGIHAVRGGSIVGEHEVIFAGHDEVISIKHQAQSKEVFAIGSINAAVFMNNVPAGAYDMNDLIKAK